MHNQLQQYLDAHSDIDKQPEINKNLNIDIHHDIVSKLTFFYEANKIPNIIFNGPSGSGKSTILNNFISMIYKNDQHALNNYVMRVNCAHGKGIKFIREELKMFAKTNVPLNGQNVFKSIILYNGDKLTMDAQSALRRCVELFSHNTRFFIVVEDKSKLLKPIVSRFCELYIKPPIINDMPVNLYKLSLSQKYQINEIKLSKYEYLYNYICNNVHKDIALKQLNDIASHLYEKSYSGLDIIHIVDENYFFFPVEIKYELLMFFDSIRYEIRNENLLMMIMLSRICVNSHNF